MVILCAVKELSCLKGIKLDKDEGVLSYRARRRQHDHTKDEAGGEGEGGDKVSRGNASAMSWEHARASAFRARAQTASKD